MPDVSVPDPQQDMAERANAIVSLEDAEHRRTGDIEEPPV